MKKFLRLVAVLLLLEPAVGHAQQLKEPFDIQMGNISTQPYPNVIQGNFHRNWEEQSNVSGAATYGFWQIVAPTTARTYVWSSLDAQINADIGAGYTRYIYTIGKVPGWANCGSWSGTGYTASGVLTVVTSNKNDLQPNCGITGAGVTAGTYITTDGTGTGGTGTYNISHTMTVGSAGSPIALTGDYYNSYKVAPDNPSDVGNFVADAIAHITSTFPQLTELDIEAWNEMDLSTYYSSTDNAGGTIVGPTAISIINSEAAAVAAAANPIVKLLAPSVTSQAMYPWLQSFLSNSTLVSEVSALAFHPYYQSAYYQLYPEQVINIDHVVSILQAEYGTNFPIYWTEYGLLATELESTWENWLSKSALLASSEASASNVKIASWFMCGNSTYDTICTAQNGITAPGPNLTYAGTMMRRSTRWLYDAENRGSSFTWTSPIARVKGTNLIPNPTGTGATGTSTPPTGWSVNDNTGGVLTYTWNSTTDPISGAPIATINISGTTSTGSPSVSLNLAPGTIPGALNDVVSYGLCDSLYGGSLSGISDVRFKLLVNGTGTSNGGYPYTYPSSAIGITSQCYEATFQLTQGTPTYVYPQIVVHFAPSSTINLTLGITNVEMDKSAQYAGTFTNGSYSGKLIWDVSGTNPTYSVTSTYHSARNMTGPRQSILYNTGGNVTLNNLPTLLESDYLMGPQP